MGLQQKLPGHLRNATHNGGGSRHRRADISDGVSCGGSVGFWCLGINSSAISGQAALSFSQCLSPKEGADLPPNTANDECLLRFFRNFSSSLYTAELPALARIRLRSSSAAPLSVAT